MTAETPCSPPIPHSRLVAHEIRLVRVEDPTGRTVAATIECERKQRTLRIETCVRCERFARIETHEAGYTMLCRSTDSEPAPAPATAREAKPG